MYILFQMVSSQVSLLYSVLHFNFLDTYKKFNPILDIEILKRKGN